MSKRSERHVRKVKQTLATQAAKSPVDRVLELGAGGRGLVPSGYSSPASAMVGMPSGKLGSYGGVTAPGTDGQIGTPGNLNVFGFLTGEDYNPDLDGYPMFGKYNQMRLSDAQVNATLLMLKLPLKGATWLVKPASDDPQDIAIADFVQANLIDDDALARSWQHVLDNAMLKFDFGCSAEEIVWGVREESWNAGAAPSSVSAAARVIEMAKHGNKWALKNIERAGDAMYSTVLDLAPRLPRTFYRWIEKDGKLETLQQYAPKNGQYGYYNIPVQQLALHVRAREGNNYYGRSVLRTAYAHWWWKSQLYRIDMIGHDRFHVGIPRASLTEDYQASTAPLDKIEQTLKGLRSHDRAYMVQPFGVTYDIYGAQSSGTGTSGILLSIEHHNMMIARNILQGFAAQGEQRRGSFGAAKVLSEAFFDAIQGEANEIASELKQAVVKPLVDMNFDMRGRKYPSILCTDLNMVDVNQLSTALAALAGQKIITPDDDLEGWLRDLMDAPDLPEDLKGQDRNPPPPTPAAAPTSPGAVPANGTSGKGGKDPALDGKNPVDETTKKLSAAQEALMRLETATKLVLASDDLKQTSVLLGNVRGLLADVRSHLELVGIDRSERIKELDTMLASFERKFETVNEQLADKMAQDRLEVQAIAVRTVAFVEDSAKQTALLVGHFVQQIPGLIAGAIVSVSKRAPYSEQGRRFGRVPTDRERAILDLHGIPSALDIAQADLVAALTTIRKSQLRTVAKRLAQKDSRPTAPFTDFRHAHIKMPQVAELVKAIRTAQDQAFAYGQQTVLEELKRQGVAGTTTLADNPTSAKNLRTAKSTLVSSAQITARRQSENWLGRTMDEGLRLRRTGLQGDDLEAALVDNLEADAESGAKKDAAGEIHEAFGLGRGTAASDWSDEIGSAEYSAILDANTCDPCQELDGEVFEVDTPEYFAAMPPYKDCDGRDSCRCVYLYLAKGEA